MHKSKKYNSIIYFHQEESHSRNVSRKSSLRSIPESEEEQEEDSTKSENEDTHNKPKWTLKSIVNEPCIDVLMGGDWGTLGGRVIFG